MRLQNFSSSARVHAQPHRIKRLRALFISDIHLGTKGCKAQLLAEFLAYHDCRTLYLVGDIIDGWRLKERWSWTGAHTRVIDAILAKAEEGTDRKSTRLNSSHVSESRMPSSA